MTVPSPSWRDGWSRIGTWIALANAAGVLVWLGVFMNWVGPTFGSFRAELVGASTFAWPFLVLASSALVLFGDHRAAARWAAWGVVALLAGVLVDQVIGAMRDGQVEAPGLRLGALMCAQLVLAVAATLMAGRR